VKRNYFILVMAIFSLEAALLAQGSSGNAGWTAAATQKGTSHGGSKGSAEKGKEIFGKKCALCHFAESDQKKIGPGLKGISKRGTFTVNGNKVTEQNLKTWIENGDSLMPPFKEVLEPAEIKDVIAYVRTL
jgi:cytochrome c